MSFKCALEAFLLGKIEEVFDSNHMFLGVCLLHSKPKSRDEVFRSSLTDSDASLTESDSLGNVGALSQKANNRAYDRVHAWPLVHDTYALTVCAGRIYQNA